MTVNLKLIEQLSSKYRAINSPDNMLKVKNLLSDTLDDEWVLFSKKAIKQDCGSYKYAFRMKWDRYLPNHTYLNSPENRNFKEFIQQVFSQFLCRTDITESQNIFNLSPCIMIFIGWLYLNEKELKPNKDYLKNISNFYLTKFFYAFARHGHLGVLNIPQRIMNQLQNELEIKIYKTDNLYFLGEKQIVEIVNYLHKLDLYTTNAFGCEIIDLNKFRSHFALATTETYGSKFKAFIRQFEPEMLNKYPGLLVKSRRTSEYPSHKTPLISEVIAKPISYRHAKKQLDLIVGLFAQYPSFPTQINPPSFYDKEELEKVINTYCHPGGHTMCPPSEVVTFYLNRSIKILLDHADDILKFYIESTSHFINQCWIGTSFSSKRNNYIKNNIPTSLAAIFGKSINVSGYCLNTAKSNDFENFRINPTLSDLMYVLFGACFVAITSLLPYRINELGELLNKCLYKKKGTGFYIRKSFLKTGISGEKISSDRPIHYISAKAIMCFKHFRRFSMDVCSSNKNSKYLLFGLDLNSTELKASAKGDSFAKQCIRKFADFIEVPLDDFGRRWYLNIHELRKFFIINFFWCFKHGHLDTLRWAVGHSNWNHLDQYLKENIDEDTYQTIQKQFLSMQLFSYVEEGRSEVDGISELYNDLCEQFNVDELSIIHKQKIQEQIDMGLFDDYEMKVYSISDSTEQFNFAIRMEKRDDRKAA